MGVASVGSEGKGAAESQGRAGAKRFGWENIGHRGGREGGEGEFVCVGSPPFK